MTMTNDKVRQCITINNKVS